MIRNNLTNKVSFEVNPIKLAGKKLELNEPAPDFVLFDNNMKEVGISQFKDKIKIITSLDSLYTPVYKLQLKEFNKLVHSFLPDAVAIAVSKDLPFSQKHFCVRYKINNLVVLSDYRYSSFSINYGLLIKELNKLAKAIVILDSNDIVRYFQITKELVSRLDYIDALDNLNKIIRNNKPLPKNKELSEKYTSYKVNTKPYSANIIKNELLDFSHDSRW